MYFPNKGFFWGEKIRNYFCKKVIFGETSFVEKRFKTHSYSYWILDFNL